MKYIITGVAGFIGFHLANRLLSEGHTVIGIDNFNDYYDVQLKASRNVVLQEHEHYRLIRMDIADGKNLEAVFNEHSHTPVVNLAAQAGVRYSIENPSAYVRSNLVGFSNILECCRNYQAPYLIYASSSSVYGTNTQLPFSEKDKADNPVSFYGATKKANEAMASSYSHLYGFPTVGLRFFTVYGPWGRPDMALFSFVRSILDGKPIKVYNNGNMKRDFTYIDDIVDGIIRVIRLNEGDNKKNKIGHRLYNIGNSSPVMLGDFITAIERALGITALRDYQPMQLGDMQETYADVTALTKDTGYTPRTAIYEGVSQFVNWYINYYKKLEWRDKNV